MQFSNILLSLVIVLVYLNVTECSLKNEQPSGVTPVNSDTSCPLWTTLTVNNTCECGNSIGGIVHCAHVSDLSKNVLVSLPNCYCMSHSTDYNMTVVGYCLVRCYIPINDQARKNTYGHFHYNILPPAPGNVSELNRCLCSDLQMHRTGLMCGGCEDNYTLPVYSYNLTCVYCSDYKYNWLKYIAVAYIPLTIFYVIAVVFRISATSGAIQGYILTAQIATAPTLSRFILLSNASVSQSALLSLKSVIAFYSIWNLDFFRSLYPPFCIHPRMSSLQILSLDYAIAVYPLLLVIVTFVFVKLHDRFSIVVWLWKPFYRCFIAIRKEWNIEKSLVETFATFLMLSYVKILNTSFDLLSPVKMYNMSGENLLWQLSFDSTVQFLDKHHRPYAVLALFFLLTINILPLLLLFLYPCRCFHRCLNCCKFNSLTLNTFMDVFQGSFKTHPHDFRCFAAFYLLLRVVSLASMTILNVTAFFPVMIAVCVFTVLMIAIFQPHRSSLHKNIDLVLFSMLVLGSITDPVHVSTKVMCYSIVTSVADTVLFTLMCVHTLFGILYFVSFFLPTTRLKALIPAVKCTIKRFFNRNTELLQHPLPYRLEHSSEYPPLIPKPSSSDSAQY